MTLSKNSLKVYNYLMDRMDRGDNPPGSRLPTEYELCQEFHHSRNTVRNAIRLLIEEGHAESRQGSGTFVARRTHQHHLNNIISLMFMGGDDLVLRLQPMALEHNCILSVFSWGGKQWRSDIEKPFLQQVKNQCHKVLLAMCTPSSPNLELLKSISANGTRIIHFEHIYQDQLPNTSYLIPDYYHIGYTGAIRLILTGYRCFFYAGLTNDGPYSKLMEQGFFDALREHGFSDGTRRSLIDHSTGGNYFPLWSDPLMSDLEDNVRNFLSYTRDLDNIGVFCSTGGRAVKLHEMFKSHDVSVPEKYGILGVYVRDADGDLSGIDHLLVDRQYLYERGLQEALKPDFNQIQELVKPEIVTGRTLRPLV